MSKLSKVLGSKISFRNLRDKNVKTFEVRVQKCHSEKMKGILRTKLKDNEQKCKKSLVFSHQKHQIIKMLGAIFCLQFQTHQSEREVELEDSVNTLTAKIASLVTECSLKEELAASYEKRAQEAIEGKEKAERELQRSKTYLDEALQEKFEVNERNISLNYALNDCMQQLASTKKEVEALKDASMESERSRIETGKKCADLMDENDRLAKGFLAKVNLLEDLRIQKAEVEAEFEGLVSRLDFLEKENGFLRYEIRMLEKDVDIWNQSVDSLQKQQLEKVKKIKKLEAECQRLRVLLHKRIPGPSTLANMWSEFEFQGTRRTTSLVKGSRTNRDDLDLTNKRITFLVDRLQNVEKENKILRDILSNRDNASCCEPPMEQALSNSVNGDENDTNSSRSWASALVLQLDHIKDAAQLNNNTPRHSKMGILEMNLMDDFVEMEKLAIVAVDKPDSCLNHATGKELVPIGNDHEETSRKNLSSREHHDWLQNILTAIKEQIQVSGKSADEILEEIKGSLDSESSKTVGSAPIASSQVRCSLEIENKGLKAELKKLKTLDRELKQSIKSAKELQETKESFKSLQAETEMLRESKQMIEDQLENQKTMNEDIDTQLNLTKSKLNDISQKFSSLQVELDDKNHCCQELEGMCLDLQLQLQSITNKEILMDNMNKDGKLLQTGWEIKAASAKLAECEAAILNLGNQLKTLTPSSNGASKGGNIVSNVYKKSIKKLDQRISLLDQMLVDDSDNVEENKSPTKPKELESVKAEGGGIGGIHGGALVVIPSKKRRGGFSFLRKLLLTRDQSGRKKKTTTTTFNFAV